MGKTAGNRLEDQFALRAGAAAIYLLVGLVLGVAVAAAALFVGSGSDLPSFAAIVFGVSAVSAAFAALFPSIALASLSPLAHLAWGTSSGALVPESLAGPSQDSSAWEQWLFWLGVSLGCTLLLVWLFS
jgi:hypothetical protein